MESKVSLEIKNHRILKVNYNPKTKLVFEADIVVGVIRNKMIFPIDEKAERLCKKYNLEYKKKNTEDFVLKIDLNKFLILLNEKKSRDSCVCSERFISLPLEVRNCNLIINIPAVKETDPIFIEDLETHKIIFISRGSYSGETTHEYFSKNFKKVEEFIRDFYKCKLCSSLSIDDVKIGICAKCKEVKNKLAIFSLNDSIIMECSICRDKIYFDYQKNENESCKHIFHHSCLRKMKIDIEEEDEHLISFLVKCPLCKADFKFY